MILEPPAVRATTAPSAASRSLPRLDKYRVPSPWRSVWQLTTTVGGFVLLWLAMWWSLEISYALTLLLALPAAGLQVRMFILQHDCGHGSFFQTRSANDMLGRALSLFTLTPYQQWRKHHAMHHATSGDLDRRGDGDVYMLTVREYQALTPFRQLIYRIYRNPLVLFVAAPLFYFGVYQRLTFVEPRSWKKERWSIFWTNISLAVAYGTLIWAVGLPTLIAIHLPIALIASSAGVWLFYVQHQFDPTYWERADDWDYFTAGVDGSSYYVLPRVLQWFSANIGLHHIHHVDSRIPNYRLQECFDENPTFQNVYRLTLWQSLSCVSLKLWDETNGQMVGFPRNK